MEREERTEGALVLWRARAHNMIRYLRSAGLAEDMIRAIYEGPESGRSTDDAESVGVPPDAGRPEASGG